MKLPKKFSPQIDLSHIPIELWKAQRMHIQGYRFAGHHSAVKICDWTKKSLRGGQMCYKNKFYGIKSHQCIQMSPAAYFCDFNCVHCWRAVNYQIPNKDFIWDNPEYILEECIKGQRKLIYGFGGGTKTSSVRYKESLEPAHFAISLSGEATLYPHLPEFIDLLKSKGYTSFLVTNGAHPEVIQNLLDHQPTNLYVTLHAPNKEAYRKECCPKISDGWEKLQKTLSLLKKFDCITVIRLTLNKKINMISPEEYASIIIKSSPKYVECKGFMNVGGARNKLSGREMPSFTEVLNFAKEIEKYSGYKIINEEKSSRVVLLEKIN